MQPIEETDDGNRLDARPEARALSVEALLDLVRRGRIRLPDFQRSLRWRASHVLELFDSIYRGFPIGELLLSKRPADAGTIAFGPVRISAGAVPDALFVVDGQQRITSLAGALLHPDPLPRGDVHAVWFDLERRRFQRLHRQTPPPAWIPLSVIADSLRLLNWLDEWPLRKERRDLAERAIELGQAVREYQIPAYIVETLNDQILRLIFKRANTSGVAMREAEVFDALSGTMSPRPVETACNRLESETAFGRIEPEEFVRCLKVVEGLDLRTSFSKSEHAARSVPLDGIGRTETALRRTTTFLAEDALIPHRDLLPYSLPLVILARFFRYHPDPEPRLRLLLSRWVWRGALSHEHQKSSDADVNALRNSIDDCPYESVERLLSSVRNPHAFPKATSRWNGRNADARAAAVAMLALEPKDPSTLLAVSPDRVRELLGAKKSLANVFRDVAGPGSESIIARRVVVPEKRHVQKLAEAPVWILQSHGIDEPARQALAKNDFHLFARERARVLDRWFASFFAEKAGIGESDRPTISEIVRRVDRALGAI